MPQYIETDLVDVTQFISNTAVYRLASTLAIALERQHREERERVAAAARTDHHQNTTLSRTASSLAVTSYGGSPGMPPTPLLPPPATGVTTLPQSILKEGRVMQLVALSTIEQVLSSTKPRINDKRCASIVALFYFAAKAKLHLPASFVEPLIAACKDYTQRLLNILPSVSLLPGVQVSNFTRAVLFFATILGVDPTSVGQTAMNLIDVEDPLTDRFALGAITFYKDSCAACTALPQTCTQLINLLVAVDGTKSPTFPSASQHRLLTDVLVALVAVDAIDANSVACVGSILIPRLSLMAVSRAVTTHDTAKAATLCAALKALSKCRKVLEFANMSGIMEGSVTPPPSASLNIRAPSSPSLDTGEFSEAEAEDSKQFATPPRQIPTPSGAKQLTWGMCDQLVDDLWSVVTDPADVLPATKSTVFEEPLLMVLDSLVTYERGCIFNANINTENIGDPTPATDGDPSTIVYEDAAIIAVQRCVVALMRPESICFGSLPEPVLDTLRSKLEDAVMGFLNWNGCLVEAAAASPSASSSNRPNNNRTCEHQALQSVHLFRSFLQKAASRYSVKTLEVAAKNFSTILCALCKASVVGQEEEERRPAYLNTSQGGAASPSSSSVSSVAAQELMDMFFDPTIIGATTVATPPTPASSPMNEIDAISSTTISMNVLESLIALISYSPTPTSSKKGCCKELCGNRDVSDTRLAARVTQLVGEQYEECVRTALSHGDGDVRQAVSQWSPFLNRWAGILVECTNNGKDNGIHAAANYLAQLMKLVVRLAWPPTGVVYSLGGQGPAPRNVVTVAIDCITPLLGGISELFTAIGAHTKTKQCLDNCTNHTERDVHSSVAEVAKQFRIFWITCSWHDLPSVQPSTTQQGTAHTTFPSQRAKLRFVAAAAPPLLRFASADYVRAIADGATLEKHLKGLGVAERVKSLQSAIGSYAPSLPPAVVSRLSFSEAVLFRALFELEHLRSSTGRILPVISYSNYDIKDFEARSEIRLLVKAAHQDVALGALKRYLSDSKVDAVEAVLLQELHIVMFHAALDIAPIRSTAAEVLSKIIPRCAQLFAQPKTVELLLNLVNVIQSSEVQEVTELCGAHGYSGVVALPYLTGGGYHERKQLLDEFTRYAESWLRSCREMAPHTLLEALLIYVVKQQQQQLVATDHQAGGWLAMSLTMGENGTLSHRKGVASLTPSRLRNFSHILLSRSRCIGELSSVLKLQCYGTVQKALLIQLKDSVRENLTVVASQPVLSEKRIKRAAHDAHQKKASDDHSHGEKGHHAHHQSATALVSIVHRVTEAFYLTGAWLHKERPHNTTSVATDRSLVQWLVLGPIHIFSPVSIQTGVEVWKWVIHSRGPAAAISLLSWVTNGWSWTSEQKIGLFDGHVPNIMKEIEVGVKTDVDEGLNLYADDYDSNSPHKILIGFIAEVFVDPNQPLAFDPSVQRLLLHLVARTVASHQQLSLKDASFSEYMRTMLLMITILDNVHQRALNVPPSPHAASPPPPAVPFSVLGSLRLGIYRCLLRWFSKPPSWYHAQSPPAAKNDASVLQELIDALHAEQRVLSQSPEGFYDADTKVPSSRMSDGNSVRLSLRSRQQQQSRREKSNSASMGARNDSGLGTASNASNTAIVTEEHKRLHNLLGLLRMLLKHEHERLAVWSDPSSTSAAPEVASALWKAYVEAASIESPEVVVNLVSRFPYPAVEQLVKDAITENPAAYTHIPEAVDLYVNEKTIKDGTPHLHLWANASVTHSLKFLSSHFTKFPQIVSYAVRSLLSVHGEHLIFFLPQILQCLSYDDSGAIEGFLFEMSSRNIMFSHQLLWTLHTEMNETNLPENDTVLSNKCAALAKRIEGCFATDASKKFFKDEFDYIDTVLALSGALKPVEKEERKAKVRQMLTAAKYQVDPNSTNVYVPTSPQDKIVSVIPHTANAMQSAAKCPILVQFNCVPQDDVMLESLRSPTNDGPHSVSPGPKPGFKAFQDDGEDEFSDPEDEEMTLHVATAATAHHPQQHQTTYMKACIFKMGDDCRQDQLALQVISLLKRINASVNLPFFLSPYRVVTTGKTSGIIECVPNSMSRDQIGKLVEGGLGEFFVQQYGHPQTLGFKKARDNFVRSMAAYSVASYILNIKDRHNGNLLVDSDGHLIHIDFGFIFDSSPGGDMNFESSPFKLTLEMLQLMGGSTSASADVEGTHGSEMLNVEVYNSFVDTTVRCYLAMRQYSNELCALIELMLESGLPCFKPVQTIANLGVRLQRGKTESEAGAFMRARVKESEDNMRTKLYDKYQQIREGIEM